MIEENIGLGMLTPFYVPWGVDDEIKLVHLKNKTMSTTSSALGRFKKVPWKRGGVHFQGHLQRGEEGLYL